MKTFRNIAVVLLFSGAAFASSHREAPAISNDPAADNTDVYAFVTTKSTTNDTLNIVANWIPFEEPSGGPNFFKWSDDVQYQIHITQGLGPIKDNIVYTFRFTTQPVPRIDSSLAGSGPNSVNGPCADPTKPVGCIGGGKEFFAQLTGDLHPASGPILDGGAIVQTYTVTKTVNGTDTLLVNTKFDGTPLKGAFVSVPENIGPRTQAVLNALAPTLVGSGTYDEAFTEGFIATTPATDGTRVFAGPRDDGFYVDLGGIFDLANLRPKAVAGDCATRPDGTTAGQCKKAQDGLAGYNVHSIALEIPTKQLTFDGNAPTAGASSKNTIGIWATSNRRKVSIIRGNGQTSSYGPWVQVSRLGIPLVNEAVIGYQDKDKYNRTKPKDDVANFGAYILNPVIVPDYEAACAATGACNYVATDALRHGRKDIVDVISLATSGCATYKADGTGTPCHAFDSGAGALADGSVGDVLRVDLGLNPATYGFPNGRSLINPNAPNMEQADVTDVELTLLLTGYTGLATNGVTIKDNVDYNDKNFLPAFPWLATPWEGYSEGHGKITP